MAKWLYRLKIVQILDFYQDKSLQVDLVTKSEVEQANWFTRSMREIGSFFSGMWNSAVDTVKGWF